MIGLNGKYLLAAAIGDMRITAMVQGAYDLLGTLSWLAVATKAAILSAFGAEEGVGVIQATKAYLNGLATTNREKAQRLANCINEDPMLVCSIVETSKTRWLVGDGKAYIMTDIIARSTLNVTAKIHNIERISNENILLGSDEGGWSSMYGINYSPQNNKVIPYLYYDGIDTASGLYTDGIFVLNQEGFYINGVQMLAKTPSAIYGTQPIAIFAGNRAGNIVYTSKYKGEQFIFDEHDDQVANFIPHLHGGVAGMLDLVSLDFYPNANTIGAFTIQLTDKEK